MAITRNVTTGEKEIEGDYLINAQGEDVVAGIRNTKPIAELQRRDAQGLRRSSQRIAKQLEKHYRDMQDVEFTIERGKLWMLQTRDGKRTAQAAVRIAVDMADERLITASEAVAARHARPGRLLPAPAVRPEAQEGRHERGDRIASGLNVSPGAAVGHDRLRRRHRRDAGPRKRSAR